MIRLTFIAPVVLAGGLLLTASAEPTQVPFPKPDASSVIPKADVDPGMPIFMTCSKSCDDCARICDTCTAHCAKMMADSGQKEHLAALRLCQDCSAICTATARVVGKDGPMADLMYTACAEACKRCGDVCEKSTDSMMKQCAIECRRCEKICRDLGKPATGKN
jgi:hypothetical protein